MSTKTTFKRIALVAVSALGLGLLTTVPSQAVVAPANISVTATNQAITWNTARSSTVSDSTTAGLITVSYSRTAAYDSVVITSLSKSVPAAATTVPNLLLRLRDTLTSTVVDTITTSGTGVTRSAVATLGVTGTRLNLSDSGTTVTMGATAASSGTAVSNFYAYIDSVTSLKVGTYVYTVTVQPSQAGVAGVYSEAKSVDISIVVSAPSAATSASYSTAYISSGSTFANVGNTVDSVVSVSATADQTADAVVRVTLADATGATTYAEESVTVVATRGSVGTSTAIIGKNVTFQYTVGSPLDIYVYGDGTSGTGTITVSTPTISFGVKNVSFYATGVATITATKRLNVLSAGTTGNTGAITAVALDSNGNQNGSSTAVYAYSSNLAVVSDSGTACTYDATNVRHTCTLTGVANGTANITLKSTAVGSVASTVISSAAISVTVNTNAVSKLVFKTDKTSYAPGEKGFIILSAVDAAGNAVAGGAYSNLLASTGITSSANLGSSTVAADLTGSSAYSPTLAYTEASAGYTSLDPVKLITFYAPVQGAEVTLTTAGGAGAGTDAGKTLTAKFTVTDNAATALAAVTALASQVSAFITKINAQITTLTDLVMKIQKKVKA